MSAGQRNNDERSIPSDVVQRRAAKTSDGVLLDVCVMVRSIHPGCVLCPVVSLLLQPWRKQGHSALVPDNGCCVSPQLWALGLSWKNGPSEMT